MIGEYKKVRKIGDIHFASILISAVNFLFFSCIPLTHLPDSGMMRLTALFLLHDAKQHYYFIAAVPFFWHRIACAQFFFIFITKLYMKAIFLF